MGTLIQRMQEHFGDDGGMSGGRMGFFLDLSMREEAHTVLELVMLRTKNEIGIICHL